MNIQYLKLFMNITTTHNTSVAAHELNLSPAVTSSHFSKIEVELGVRLEHRITRKISPTQEAKDLLPYAKNVISCIEATRASAGVGNLLH